MNRIYYNIRELNLYDFIENKNNKDYNIIASNCIIQFKIWQTLSIKFTKVDNY